MSLGHALGYVGLVALALGVLVDLTRTLLTLARRNDERERRKQSAQARTHLHLIRAQEGR